MEIFITLNKYKTRQQREEGSGVGKITLFVTRPTKPTSMAQGPF